MAKDSKKTIIGVRQVDYDGGRRGKVWQEFYFEKAEDADEKFAELSRPRQYGGSRSSSYEPYEITHYPPPGLIKAVCLKFDMLVVEYVLLDLL